MKILILDDEQLDLFITKKLLSSEYQTEGFTTVESTLTWARNNDFDVVLIDYYLAPGMHAQDALKKLTSIKEHPFKAFVLSNYVDEQQVRELKQAGFNDVILKPLTVEKFKEFLNVANLIA